MIKYFEERLVLKAKWNIEQEIATEIEDWCKSAQNKKSRLGKVSKQCLLIPGETVTKSQCRFVEEFPWLRNCITYIYLYGSYMCWTSKFRCFAHHIKMETNDNAILLTDAQFTILRNIRQISSLLLFAWAKYKNEFSFASGINIFDTEINRYFERCFLLVIRESYIRCR